MSVYREVRVRPVVRYIVTLFEMGEENYNEKQNECDIKESSMIQHSVQYGVFDNVDQANIVGRAIADMENAMDKNAVSDVVFEPARRLRIDWIRGPGEPQDAIRWELSEIGDGATVVS